jgi:hypothetical protein
MNIMEKMLRKGLEPVNATEEKPHHLKNIHLRNLGAFNLVDE